MVNKGQDRETIEQFCFSISKTNEVDVDTLINTLQSFHSIIQEVNGSLTPEKYIQIKIQPFKQGSFEWVFAILNDPAITNNILTSIGLLTSKESLVAAIKDLFGLFKFLKGQKPKSIKKIEGENYEMENNSGEIRIVNGNTHDIYLNNPTIIHNTYNIYSDVSKVKEANGFKLKDIKGETIFSAEKDDIDSTVEEYEKNREEGKLEKRKFIYDSNALLYVAKPDLIGKRKTKWNFIYKSHSIAAQVKDDKYLERVAKGIESFKNGTVLLVDLKINQELHEVAKTYQNISYEVLHVKSTKNSGGKQSKFDL